MHVGHARGAVFGDALANLLDFAGRKVTREYYINDAGAQVDVLARSAYLRYREALGEDDRRDPRGPLSRRLSQAARRGARARNSAPRCATSPRPTGCRVVRARAIAAMMAMIRDDLAALNIVHEVFSSERALTGADGGEDQVRAAIEDLRAAASSMSAGCRRPRATCRRIGRIASRRCSARPNSATTSTGR